MGDPMRVSHADEYWADHKALLVIKPNRLSNDPHAYLVEILGGNDLRFTPGEAEALGQRLIRLAKEARERVRPGVRED